MSIARLIKHAPTVILVGYLGYSLFTIQPGLADSAGAQQALERALEDLVAEGTEATDALKQKIRDPFWVTDLTAAPQQTAAIEAPTKSEDDALGEFVRGLSLDATFLQGRDQIAVINGRIYTRGQHLKAPGDGDSPDRDLRLTVVTRTGVTLRGGGKNYSLGYPEQLGRKTERDGPAAPAQDRTMAEIEQAGQAAMFQQLLNSPLGALGKGLLGEAGRSAGGRASASGTPRTRGSGR